MKLTPSENETEKIEKIHVFSLYPFHFGKSSERAAASKGGGTVLPGRASDRAGVRPIGAAFGGGTGRIALESRR